MRQATTAHRTVLVLTLFVVGTMTPCDGPDRNVSLSDPGAEWYAGRLDVDFEPRNASDPDCVMAGPEEEPCHVYMP